MGWAKNLNPSRLYAVIGAVFILLGTLGATWLTDDLKNAILGVVSAIVTLVVGETIRPKVVSNDNVLSYVDDPTKETPEVYSGNATLPYERMGEVVEASMTQNKNTKGRHAAPEEA